MPGKTYEYLASGRPILAAVPDGDARDLLEPLPHAHLTRPRDVDTMAATLRELIAAERAQDAAALTAYERSRLTAQLAGIFDRVLELTTSELLRRHVPSGPGV